MKWYNPFRKLLKSNRIKRAIKNNELHPDLKDKADKLIEVMEKHGYTVDVHKGVRTFIEQEKLYAKGRTSPGRVVTYAMAGRSWHNYGLAIDVVFKDKRGWSWAEKWPWDLLGEEGEKLGLEWGGRFKKLKDRPHFQMTGKLKIREAKKIYEEKGLKKVWDKVRS
jgi:peptidoglycan LD-endopeptidase CwlK